MNSNQQIQKLPIDNSINIEISFTNVTYCDMIQNITLHNVAYIYFKNIKQLIEYKHFIRNFAKNFYTDCF